MLEDEVFLSVLSLFLSDFLSDVFDDESEFAFLSESVPLVLSFLVVGSVTVVVLSIVVNSVV